MADGKPSAITVTKNLLGDLELAPLTCVHIWILAVAEPGSHDAPGHLLATVG